MRKNERGAIVVEATIALFAFVFAIITLLGLVNICYIQEKIGTALAVSAKELSVYSHMYYMFSLDEKQKSLYYKNADMHQTAEATLGSVGSIIENIGEAGAASERGNIEQLSTSLRSGAGSAADIYGTLKDQLKDPKNFALSLGKLALGEGAEFAKDKVGQVLLLAMMQKNLRDYDSQDPVEFLRGYRVKGGAKGLDLRRTVFMPDGRTTDIIAMVTYEVVVLRLLNIDVSFRFTQCARTGAWGNGVSFSSTGLDISKDPKVTKSIWDDPPLSRGRQIVEAEKKNYRYTGSGQGFDAYDPGSNEFVLISSGLPEGTADKSWYVNKLNRELSDREKTITARGDSYNVADSGGGSSVLYSAPGSRSYKIVLVVPENADTAMIKTAISEFEQKARANGESVTVELKTGYGVPGGGETK